MAPGVLEEILTSDTSGKFVGPMPVDAFLGDFFPTSPCVMPQVDMPSSKPMQCNGDGENKEIGELDVWKSLTKTFVPFFGNLRICKTAGSFDQRWRVYKQNVKPAIAVYEADVPPDVDTDISRMETWIEVTTHEEDDPFEDPPSELSEEDLFEYLETHPFERDDESGMLTRGRALAHVIAQLGSQYRNFAFSTIIFGKCARLVRWDRAGAVVSRRFDWTEKPELLASFFWRFSMASREERGTDETVSLADVGEEEATVVRQRLELLPDEELFAYLVHDDSPPSPSHNGANEQEFSSASMSRTYYGPCLDFMPWELTGSSTRTFVLWDLAHQKKFFVKDTWRRNWPSVEKEGDIYRILKSHDVSHIAPMVCSGDVLSSHGMKTRTQDYSKRYLGIRISGYVHYRIAFGVVGARLKDFSAPHQLFSALADALEAHKGAYTRAKILHRDISAGNVILSPTGEGLLIDWDHCLNMNNPASVETQVGFTGTWEFASARLLMEPDTETHVLQDDLESFLHVATWMSVRNIPSELSPDVLEDYLNNVFRERVVMDGLEKGGFAKELRLMGNNRWLPDDWLHGSPLPTLLGKLARTFAVRYIDEPSDADREDLQILAPYKDKNPRMYESMYACVYDRSMAALQTHDWMIERMREASRTLAGNGEFQRAGDNVFRKGMVLDGSDNVETSRRRGKPTSKRLRQSATDTSGSGQRLSKKLKQN